MLTKTLFKNKNVPSFTSEIHISQKEREVLNLICQEYTSNETGQKLSISGRTIARIKDYLMERFGCKNTAGLVFLELKLSNRIKHDSILEAIIFILYLLLFCYFITKFPFFKKCGLRNAEIIALFVVKIAAGLAYALFYKLPKYYTDSDTWRFYRLSLQETDWLMKDPAAFIKDLFIHGYKTRGNIFGTENTYWNDLKSNIPVKMMAVMNLFCNRSYYTNIIFFNFIFIIGLVALYKVFVQYFGDKKYILITGIFLMPSTLFWCSGIHKDGLILSAIGLLIYAANKIVHDGYRLKYIIAALVSCVLIFVLRNYVLLALLPALFCWLLSIRFPKQSLFIFISVYAVVSLLFFASPFLPGHINLMQFICKKQWDFLQLKGQSAVAVQLLQPNFQSFMHNLPSAADIALLRPHITEWKNISYWPAIAENLFLFTIVAMVIYRRPPFAGLPLIVWMFWIFGLTVLLISGYTVPFTGAIVRYRSLVFPFIVTPLLLIAANETGWGRRLSRFF